MRSRQLAAFLVAGSGIEVRWVSPEPIAASDPPPAVPIARKVRQSRPKGAVDENQLDLGRQMEP